MRFCDQDSRRVGAREAGNDVVLENIYGEWLILVPAIITTYYLF